MHTLTTAEAFLPMLQGHPQKSAPGERFAYCNGGYMVLAVLLERATASTYHDVVRRLVLEPAGLKRTGFLPLNELPADAAPGYIFNEGDQVHTLHLPVLGDGGASFRSTHIVGAQTTLSVLGNSSQGAWPVVSALAEAIDAELG